MTAIKGKVLRERIDNMTDKQRYALLATLRTGEHLSPQDNQLRWYFLRMIVTRAYIKSYKHSYSCSRDWYEEEPRGHTQGYKVSYELEVTRILELIEHIKEYKAPALAKVKDGYTPDTAAVAIAIKSYYMRFIQYDMTLLLESKGVSFNEHKYKRGKEGNVITVSSRVKYSRILELDKYLRAAKWDVKTAIRAWVYHQNKTYDTGSHKRPTPGMILGMYARMIRHASVMGMVHAESIEAMTEYQHENETSVDLLDNAVSGTKTLYDIGSRYDDMTKEVQEFRLRRYHNDYY